MERSPEGVPVGLRHSGGYYVAVETLGRRVTALRLLEDAPSRYTTQDVPADAGTLVMSYRYDNEGNLVEVVNSSGDPLKFTYDDQGRILKWTDRNGTWFSYQYDERGRVVRTDGVEGILSGSLAYDETARITTYTDSMGCRSTHRYNSEGLVVEETDPLGHTTRTEWDARGDKPLTVTDALGRTSRYRYDEFGSLVELTLPDQSVARVAYNVLGQPVEVIDPGGAIWRHAYDAAGNLLMTADPLGAETRYAYDATGYLIAVTDALGHTREIEPNAAGLPLAVTDELGNTTIVHRDSFGRVVETVDPLGHVTRTGWTVEGKPLWYEHADGSRESWTWDGEGNLLSHSDAAGNLTRHTPGPFDRPARRIDPDGTAYAFAYDTELRLTEVTNPQGLTWSYTYDEAGRLVAETDFNDRALNYTHDAAGRLVSRSNGLGETLRLARDVMGRVTEQRSDAGEVSTYVYDITGDIVRASNSDVEVVTRRDGLGRALSETVNGRTTSLTYDLLGRRVQRVTPSGMSSDVAYDATGRPTQLMLGYSALSFAYDAAGRETERRIGGGVVLRQSWDTTRRLATQALDSASDGGERLLQYRAYTYRPDGYLTEIRELTTGTRKFVLDEMGRVAGVQAHGWTETYVYDTAGNPTHATAPAHPSPGDRAFERNLLRRAGRTIYTHDAQGRLTRKTRKLLNGQRRIWTYTWNVEDRLTGVITPEGDRWRYVYDPHGRRTAKLRLCEDGAETDRTVFVWDGTRLAEQVAQDGRVTTWDYTPGTHTAVAQTDHRPLVRRAGTSLLSMLADDTTADYATRSYAVITDAVGTPTELVTHDGELAWQHRTTLWGTQFPDPLDVTVADCPLRFPGQFFDPESGLHYNHHRYYDPESARYISQDPLGLEPAPNPGTYVHNPSAMTDPLGLAPCNQTLSNRTEAFNAARDRAGVPRSQQPTRQWTVGGDPKQQYRVSNYVYDANPGSHGIYYQYETPQGTRVIVNHTNDPNAPNPHFHAGQPKVGSFDVDMMGQRYQQVGEKHHFYYPEG